MSPRRSYDQYCSAARALDLVGDRWTLLIVRELLAGPRRYTDLHADLPGVSTDVLASRLKDMERDGLATRRRLPPPGAAYVYELTRRGRELLPVVQALGAWGQPELGERGPTDAVRAHWFALPLLRALAEEGLVDVRPADVRPADVRPADVRLTDVPPADVRLVEVRLDEGDFHLYVGAEDGPVYGDGQAPAEPEARLAMDTSTGTAVARGLLRVSDAVRSGRITVTGDSPLAKALREA
ncbi:winged helix-turn-helix transcriptional regulator [Streptomyces sp. NPDC056161]|uniref:winged helix-turn-helix transcriptional regulator n=1 Tax=Streptomyces sp. NPDC056161 TaxID=3345732 RepID=UPI0035E07393